MPINEQSVPSYQEIEREVRQIAQKYEGEELVRRLTDFYALSLIEVLLTNDPKPTPLWRLGPEKIEILGRLSTGLEQAPSD